MNKQAITLLRDALELCTKILDHETDTEILEGIGEVADDLETVIEMLEQRSPAIPLNDNGPAR